MSDVPTDIQAGLGADYMAHSDAMHQAAAIEQYNAIFGPKDAKQPAQTPQPNAPATDSESTWDKIGKAADSVGTFVVDQPRTIYKGLRDTYQGIIDTAKMAGDFLNKHLPALQLTGEGAPHFVSADERAANPNLPPSLADSINLPDMDEPHTAAGVAEKNVIQFIAGMGIAGKQLEGLGIAAQTGGVAEHGITAVKGFMSMAEAFETPKADLSNLVQSVPALQNPVTDLLSIKGDDSAVVARLKAAAEGTLSGQAIDGLVSGIRFLRGAINAKGAASAVPELDAENAAEANAAEANKAASAGMTALGDFNEPLVSASFNRSGGKIAAQEGNAAGVSPEDLNKMGETAEQSDASPGTGSKINFARISSSDDIKNVMQELANRFSGNIEEARRGIQTFADTKMGADSINAWDLLMSRRTGDALNAEQSLAARELWTTSGAKLREITDIAMAPGGATPENLMAYYKMLTTHLAIEQEVMGARAEAGRALGSYRILASAQSWRLGDITKVLGQDAGSRPGLDALMDMAQRTKAIFDGNEVSHLGDFVEKSVYAKTRDAILEAWTNGLLTAPLTHVKVAVSNAATVALRMSERFVAEKAAQLLGDQDSVAMGESAAQYAGLVGGLKDALRYAGRGANAALNEQPLPALGTDPLSNAIKAGKSGHYSVGEGDYTQDQNMRGAISSHALNISSSGWLGQGVDLLGQVIRTPGRALTAEHDFFRSIGYRMELHALAVRQATSEVNSGKITQDALGGRIAEIIANPPPSVSIGAIDAMKYQTFTDAPGKLAESIEKIRNDFPMMRVILPFYKIPSRILSFTFERTPIAPLMASYQANIAAGGARASLARTQMGLGTGILLASADAVLSGQITGSGPASKSQRAAMMDQGWLPYSMKVGNRWVQYNKVETAGSSMAMAADIVETLHNYQSAVNGDGPEDVDMSKIAIAAGLAVAQDVTSKTYLQGLSKFFDTMANPKTEGEGTAQSLAGSIVPAGVAAIDRVQDPYQRAIYSMLDAVKARTPGSSEDLPPRQNTWGEPIKSGSGLGKAYDLLSPFATREPQDVPIDKEILRLGVNINRPAAEQDFGHGAIIDLSRDPKMYARFMALAGNEFKEPSMGNMGAKDALNSLVKGDNPFSSVYAMQSDGPQGGKSEMIKGIVSSYLQGAREQLLDEYPKLRHEVEEKQAALQSAKKPP